jgi:transcriptional regulator with XRE-family HTH domain
MSDVSQIDGNAVRLQRESQGWALSDLATRACLSVKQVRQIEEGGMTAFYSETVKLTAARKIAALLQMSEQQLFGQTMPAAVAIDVEAQDDPLSAQSTTQVLGLTQWGGLNSQNNPITRSEVLHELAQPPEHVEEDAPAQTHPVSLEGDKPEALSVEDQALAKPDLIQPAQSNQATPPPTAETETASPSASGHYFLKILALFVVALAAAALLKQNAVEEKPATPAAEAPAAPEPPLVLPPSMADPAAQPAPAAAVSETKPITEPKPATTEPKQASSEPKPASAETKPAAPAPAAKPAESNPP